MKLMQTVDGNYEWEVTMPRVLSEEAIAQYRREGYYFPVSILDAGEVAACRQNLEAFESSQGHPMQGAQRSKSHLLFTWIDDLMRRDQILDAVEDVIGPDILCWNTIFWIKEAHTDTFVSWHQDLRYWGLDRGDMVTVWLALSPATAETGCMRVLPGSHVGDLLPHSDEYQKHNMLPRGQEISVEVDESKAVAMPLQPGCASFHNGRLAHAAGPIQSTERRIGISFHYMPTSTDQVIGEWDSAALVRGEDVFGHFVLAPQPNQDFDPELVEFHQKATDAVRDVLFKDAEKVRKTI